MKRLFKVSTGVEGVRRMTRSKKQKLLCKIEYIQNICYKDPFLSNEQRISRIYNKLSKLRNWIEELYNIEGVLE